ncbi:MFS multidrug transporter [Penicillium chermesinum]|uniref:MFS multidrug transporter n=1 Tax=Penicillium chermesinum TaxID=63820 RepID=A0A9W9NJA9_9EURO|nr:MFS multidrug transporter [Penicillium chermesinum]KAJ5219653.1 MFS multidrug transporter [Penicillium chermesinum]KAJ6153657.1 MFS multidrug transporter [Penicillium chermesinum]
MSGRKQEKELDSTSIKSLASTSSDSADIPAAIPRPRNLSDPYKGQERRSGVNSNPITPLDRFSGSYLDDAASYYDPDDDYALSVQRTATIQEETDAAGPRSVDLEKGPTIDQVLERSSTVRSTLRDASKFVTWDGPDDPENPKNWPLKWKWAATVSVSLFTFISPVSSSMVAPALVNIAEDLHITQEFTLQLTLSMFILAYAVGPLFIGPLSEVYGRMVVLQLSNLIFLAFNIGCAFSQTTTQLLVCRFFAGLGGSASLAVGGGVLADCFRPEERGKSVSMYSLAPLLGPAVGPIAGGFIAERTTWRWVFYATSIADACIQVIGLFFLRESYAPVILAARAARLRKETGDETYYTEADLAKKSLSQTADQALLRPFRLILTQPIVQVMALFMAYIYGTMYLVLSSFPTLWTSPKYYNESPGIGSLNYLSLALGLWTGTQVTAPLNDRVYRALMARNNGVGRPEFRLPLMVITALCMPVGFFIYGWTAEAHCHWIAPNIGAFIMSIGLVVGFQCIQTYVIDTYTRYAASAQAAVAFLRSIAGFGFPLFAPYMYNALAYGWGNSVLAFVAIALGIPTPIFLWFYGERLRKRTTYAAG